MHPGPSFHPITFKSLAKEKGSSAGKESTCNAGDPSSIPGSICCKRDRLPTPVFLGFLGNSAGKESICNAEYLGLILGLEKGMAGEGNGYPLQYSGLENSMDCIVHGVTKSQTQLRDLHFQGKTRLQNFTTNVMF